MRTLKVKSVDPFNTSVAIERLNDSLEILVQVSMGYSRREHATLSEKIARMAIMHRRNPESAEIKREYDNLLDSYERDFSFLHRGPAHESERQDEDQDRGALPRRRQPDG